MKIIKILLIVLSILNIIDLITAKFILTGESNIVYLYFGFTPLIIGKILFSIFLIYLARRVIDKWQVNYFKYIFSYILIIGIGIYSFAVYSNITGILNPQLLSQSASVSVAVKASYYIKTMIIMFIIPMIINTIHYFVYEKWRTTKDERIVKVEIQRE